MPTTGVGAGGPGGHDHDRGQGDPTMSLVVSVTDAEEWRSMRTRILSCLSCWTPELRAQALPLRITGLRAQQILRKVRITTNKGK